MKCERNYSTESPPRYYECGCCNCYHPADWHGDCRDDAARFAMDELDAQHTAYGWIEVEMSEVDA